ncbi:hypothetical protein F442_14646 [Phytophthora nicotianae P10297]|uniref:MULE transposase domain-containing protein n=1 Tax=Phytophthora nicotianae P10297 TaxID=1317064 RepID=W2YR87_PHYNI|nr:hypothetical protein F442_14646 [Phytophthora nicotianae P10297]
MAYYIMGDVDDAQYNAIGNTVGESQPFVYLMCFFHVMKNVNDRSKSVEDMLANRVRKDIYDLHFAANLQDFVTKAYNILAVWRSDEVTRSFADYFSKVWLSGKFIRLQ